MMASFVEKVLLSAEDMDYEEINQKLAVLGKQMQLLTFEVHSSMQSYSTASLNLGHKFDVTITLAEKVRTLSAEMDELSKRIESENRDHLKASMLEFQTLIQQLEQVNMVMKFLNRLSTIHGQMEDVEAAIGERQYRQAVSSFCQLDKALQATVSKGEEEVNILMSLHIEASLLRERVESIIVEKWDESVVWMRTESCTLFSSSGYLDSVCQHHGHGEGNVRDCESKRVELKVPRGDGDCEQGCMREIVACLCTLNRIDGLMCTFAHLLWQNILELIIQQQHKIDVSEDRLDKGKLLVMKMNSEQTDCHMLDIFSLVSTVLYILNDSFLHLPVITDREMDPSDCDDGVTLMTLVGMEIGEKVLNGIVNRLRDTIPSTPEGLEDFKEVVVMTTTFQKKLTSLGFADDTSGKLVDYVNNVNMLFAEKKCQEILRAARSLMMSDVCKTVLISPDAMEKKLAACNDSTLEDNSRSTCVKYDPLLSSKTFQFPICRVSILSKVSTKLDIFSKGRAAVWKTWLTIVFMKRTHMSLKESQRLVNMQDHHKAFDCIAFNICVTKLSANIKDVLDLAYHSMKEVVDSPSQCSVQIFYGVRDIFELFCCVFPTYHAHSLAHSPLAAALHHNNCMFLAHHLLTMGHQFKHGLPQGVTATFVDLIPEIRSLGTLCLSSQMNSQKCTLEQYLSGANEYYALEESGNYNKAEAATKQALQQIDQLQNAWQSILPDTVYHKAVGACFNSVVVQMMNQITVLEDISSQAAQRLVMLLMLVDTKGRSLFTTTSQDKTVGEEKGLLLKHVGAYMKFCELRFVLTSSLQAIADRWTHGAGPLTEHFSPIELKQLIRALFQNTERRAAVLSRIK